MFIERRERVPPKGASDLKKAAAHMSSTDQVAPEVGLLRGGPTQEVVRPAHLCWSKARRNMWDSG